MQTGPSRHGAVNLLEYFEVMTQTEHSHIVDVVRRTGAPLLLFSSALTGLLVLSQAVLLPRVTTVEIAGVRRNMHELQRHHDELRAQLVSMETKRNTLILPVHDENFVGLVEQKHHVADALAVRSTIENAASDFRSEDGEPAVHLGGFFMNNETGEVEIRGDIRNVSTASMTVLAEFVDALKLLPGVVDLANPKFERLTDPKIGMYSPFTIRFTLRP